jgi:hypothetical protein
MKYAAKTTKGGMMYIPIFMSIGSAIQVKLKL